MQNTLPIPLFAIALTASLSSGNLLAVTTFDDFATNNWIQGSGVDNGALTVDRANGVELGLRGKLRHNASGAPENTFNSNGDGTYSFPAGVAPTQSSPTAVWSFEWSINSNFDGTGSNLDAFTYLLEIDSDPSQGTSFASFDPINGLRGGLAQWDHAIGDNSTANSGGTSIPDSTSNRPGYASLIANNNLAQNSWKAHWFVVPFDPTVDGTYDFTLSAFENSSVLASTSIQIIAGVGGAAVPDGGSMILMFGGSLFGLAGVRRFAAKRS